MKVKIILLIHQEPPSDMILNKIFSILYITTKNQ